MTYPTNWQRFDSHHGRPESYWTERNALVDAVRAALPNTIDVPAGGVDNLPFDVWPQEKRDALKTASAALEAFDAANGGAPIL